MNSFLIFVLIVLIGRYLLDLIVDLLNLKHLTPDLPTEFIGYYDPERYAKSQNYTRDNTRLKFWSNSFSLAVLLPFILLGGFNWVDHIARSAGWGAIPSGLLFAAILFIAGQIIDLPFNIYDTFVLEERYGFNRTTPKTYVADFFKSIGLTILIGAPILAVAIWFFGAFEKFGWIYLWVAMTAYTLVMIYIAPVVFLPMFNKFVPIEDGELKTSIEAYASRQEFKLKGIFTMDGSKRSSKANAFFTGFGKFRRIALYDTIIQQLTIPEIVAVLGHEVGHYKLGHIPKRMALGVLNTGLMLFFLNFFVRSHGLAAAFRMDHASVYAGLIFFTFLYTPISIVLKVVFNALSRRDEYQADAFAARTTGSAIAMIEVNKKLSVESLSNLTPHPMRVLMDYDHPPVLERIAALRALG